MRKASSSTRRLVRRDLGRDDIVLFRCSYSARIGPSFGAQR
jgi:hypothetical protein